MDKSEPAPPRPDLPTPPADAVVPDPVSTTARAQRLASALRDNLKRRKAAGRTGKPAKPSN